MVTVLVKQPNIIQLNFFKRNSPVILLSSFARQVTLRSAHVRCDDLTIALFSLDGRTV